MNSPRRLALALALLSACDFASAAALCENEPVLTPLADDTQTRSTLFALKSRSAANGEKGAESDWLVVLDAQQRQALIFPDPLAGLRTGASFGPGPFLAASRCGDDCFQPIQWSAPGWQPLGPPIEFNPSSSLHFTYDRSGTPWLVFHQLTPTPGVLEATAYRWDGETWSRRGRLAVQGVGSPAVTADPRSSRAVLSGTGRFDATAEPDYWLPALPVPTDSPGGQVIALAGRSAAFLTFDSRILSTSDGATWQLERWTPWPNPLGRGDVWSGGSDYSLDRPAGGRQEALELLWYDDRRPARPAVHLTHWESTGGWYRQATVDIETIPGGVLEYVVSSGRGSWLFVGACRASESRSWLDALALAGDAGIAVPLEIPLSRGWPD